VRGVFLLVKINVWVIVRLVRIENGIKVES